MGHAGAPSPEILFFLFCFVLLKIYLFMRDTEREAETQAEEKQAPHKELDVGLDPRITT